MSAVQIRVTTFEYQSPNFAYYELFADETFVVLGGVENYAPFKLIFFADYAIHANLQFGDTWHYWLRAVYDNGDTEGPLNYLGSITISGTSDGTDDQTAGEVPYDDTATGLGAGNVQEAIQALAAGAGSASTFPPQGRLTLTTAVPVLTSSVTAAATIYYTPHNGKYVPIYDGANFIPTAFAELSQTTTDSTKSPAACEAFKNYDLFVWNDGGTIRCTRGPAWTRAQTFTVTIATPAVFSLTAHGFWDGMPIVFSTSGALPAPLVAGTVYYVITAGLTANAFEVSATRAGAAINTTGGTQSGVHTVTEGLTTRGTGAGTTEISLVNGIYTNTVTITNGPAAGRGTYVGTITTDVNSQVNMIFGGVGAAGGESSTCGVWNAYNRVNLSFANFDNTDSWNYTTNTFRIRNGNFNNATQWVCGLRESHTIFTAHGVSSNSTNSAHVLGAARNGTTVTVAAQFSLGSTTNSGGTITRTHDTQWSGSGLGWNYCCGLELSQATGTTSWFGDNGGTTDTRNCISYLNMEA